MTITNTSSNDNNKSKSNSNSNIRNTLVIATKNDSSENAECKSKPSSPKDKDSSSSSSSPSQVIDSSRNDQSGEGSPENAEHKSSPSSPKDNSSSSSPSLSPSLENRSPSPSLLDEKNDDLQLNVVPLSSASIPIAEKDKKDFENFALRITNSLLNDKKPHIAEIEAKQPGFMRRAVNYCLEHTFDDLASFLQVFPREKEIKQEANKAKAIGSDTAIVIHYEGTLKPSMTFINNEILAPKNNPFFEELKYDNSRVIIQKQHTLPWDKIKNNSRLSLRGGDCFIPICLVSQDEVTTEKVSGLLPPERLKEMAQKYSKDGVKVRIFIPRYDDIMLDEKELKEAREEIFADWKEQNKSLLAEYDIDSATLKPKSADSLVTIVTEADLAKEPSYQYTKRYLYEAVFGSLLVPANNAPNPSKKTNKELLQDKIQEGIESYVSRKVLRKLEQLQNAGKNLASEAIALQHALGDPVIATMISKIPPEQYPDFLAKYVVAKEKEKEKENAAAAASISSGFFGMSKNKMKKMRRHMGMAANSEKGPEEHSTSKLSAS